MLTIKTKRNHESNTDDWLKYPYRKNNAIWHSLQTGNKMLIHKRRNSAIWHSMQTGNKRLIHKRRSTYLGWECWRISTITTTGGHWCCRRLRRCIASSITAVSTICRLKFNKHKIFKIKSTDSIDSLKSILEKEISN